MTDRRRLRFVALCAAGLLAACAGAPQRPASGDAISRGDEVFDIAGRLSARQGTQGAAANFRWSHRADRDLLTFASPLGSTLANLEGTASGVRLTLPDGRIVDADHWEALTLRTLGAPIPVRGLASWVRGVAHRGSAHGIERDASGRAAVIRQDGWEIVYAYADASPRPSRLQLSYEDTELRLVIDAWEDAR